VRKSSTREKRTTSARNAAPNAFPTSRRSFSLLPEPAEWAPLQRLRNTALMQHSEPTASHASTAEKKSSLHLPDASADHPIWSGSCPICGMALEPMDAFAQVEADPEYDSMRFAFLGERGAFASGLLLSMLGESFGVHLTPAAETWSNFFLPRRSSSGAAGPFLCASGPRSSIAARTCSR